MNTVSGALIGAVLGFISAFGLIRTNAKKSQWGMLLPIIAPITTIIGAVSGGKIGYNIERSIKIDRSLGIDRISYYHFKVGRFWQSESTWQDCKGGHHRLKTLKGSQNTVSYFDGTLVSNHGTSASSVNITKYHDIARKETFNQLREKKGDEFLRHLNSKA